MIKERNMLRPNKEGQIVKFHTPMPDEDPSQLYVVLEVKDGPELPRVDIMALNTGLGSFTPISTVNLDDVMVVEINTTDLIGHKVVVNVSDNKQVEGRVKTVIDPKVLLDLTKGSDGVETNVRLTVLDKEGKEHTGTLFVGKP